MLVLFHQDIQFPDDDPQIMKIRVVKHFFLMSNRYNYWTFMWIFLLMEFNGIFKILVSRQIKTI